MPHTKALRHEEGRRVGAQDGVHPIRYDGVLARSLPQLARLWIASLPPPYARIWGDRGEDGGRRVGKPAPLVVRAGFLPQSIHTAGDARWTSCRTFSTSRGRAARRGAETQRLEGRDLNVWREAPVPCAWIRPRRAEVGVHGSCLRVSASQRENLLQPMPRSRRCHGNGPRNVSTCMRQIRPLRRRDAEAVGS
jgi:hypothetical protein